MSCTAPRHLTYSAYRNYGCKCPAARRAYNRRRKQIDAGIAAPLLTDATGTRRRVQALMAMGWPTRTVFREAGLPDGTHIYRYPTVHVETAAKFRQAYDRLAMTPGPSARSRALAAKAGYPSPLAWDDDTIDDPAAQPNTTGILPVLIDEVAVERALHGDLDRTLTPSESRLAVLRGVRSLRLQDPEIAARLRVSADEVRKIRLALDLPAIGRLEARAC